MKTEIIAFYLPQYHPTPHNNEWWGEGFTEWTNVAKAKPLFRGHYQPKIPADLGFYDLRMPEVREKQAELAREAGVTAFCYYHYWFGNGHQELELPFNQVVESGKPDFPFCLCWANESWYQKFWNKDGAVTDKKILAEQKYPGEEDNRLHFMSLLNAFRDERYYKIDGKLAFGIYKPLEFENLKTFVDQWNLLAKEYGLPGFFFWGYTINVEKEEDAIMESGMDAVVSFRKNRDTIRSFGWAVRKALSLLFHTPRKQKYEKACKTLVSEKERKNNIFPVMIPNWDHTPRSGVNGDLYTGSTPELFEKHAIDVLEHIKDKPAGRKIAFLKSWNEWGEGNYMEPDLKFGRGYIQALRNAINEIQNAC